MGKPSENATESRHVKVDTELFLRGRRVFALYKGGDLFLLRDPASIRAAREHLEIMLSEIRLLEAAL